MEKKEKKKFTHVPLIISNSIPDHCLISIIYLFITKQNETKSLHHKDFRKTVTW